MITLDGTIQRKFHFPADPETTLHYFSDLSRVVFHLPHITLLEAYEANEVRIRYQTVELGAYTINIVCDLESIVRPDEMSIIIQPLEGKDPVEGDASLNSTSGYGYYSSTAHLYAEGDGTAIDYEFRFRAELQRPRGLRMMPKRVVNRIAVGISEGRIEEIAEGFMVNAREAFAEWLESREAASLAR